MAEYLIVGQGSMGKRRVRCLLANGCQPQQISVFDERQDRLAESQENYRRRVRSWGYYSRFRRVPPKVGRCR